MNGWKSAGMFVLFVQSRANLVTNDLNCGAAAAAVAKVTSSSSSSFALLEGEARSATAAAANTPSLGQILYCYWHTLITLGANG